MKFKMPGIPKKKNIHRHSDKKQNIDYGYDWKKTQSEQS